MSVAPHNPDHEPACHGFESSTDVDWALFNWPRTRDLPENEQEPFEAWLSSFGATRPMINNVPMSEQDGYFAADYEKWQRFRARRLV